MLHVWTEIISVWFNTQNLRRTNFTASEYKANDSTSFRVTDGFIIEDKLCVIICQSGVQSSKTF